ncbi:hypothetical protein [Streptomyces sp. NRRL B-1347]|uniref:hypothetical protein n=1 Tax=Streptomyces sp. NRRL B-1347 TaxID=1476877 RepID=UPI0004CAE6B7|nr:hypothetical protein [Streptomyces sp. NRRL B-1347]
MSFIAEMIRRADGRIRERCGVDAGLKEVAARADDIAQGDGNGQEATLRLLAERHRGVEKASASLDQLTADVKHRLAALPFLPEGWSEQRDRLQEALASDVRTGLGHWLGYWFTAASRCRVDAMDRLRTGVPPPVGALFTRRISLATRALARSDWDLCHEVLALGCQDLDIGRWKGLDDGVRDDLRLLLARLALLHHLPEEADKALGGSQPSSAAHFALRSRTARLRGATEKADRLFREARELDPRDLDTTVEAITRARQNGMPELALDEARTAAEAFSSLSDVEGDINRLVDIPGELYVALAERLRREGDRSSALCLLDRAAEERDDKTMAVVEEQRADLLGSASARRSALLCAGRWHLGAGRLDHARRDFDAAVQSGPESREDERTRAVAQMHLADIAARTGSRWPVRERGARLADALAKLLDARQQAGASGGESWNYLTESYLRDQLAEVSDADRQRQGWCALLSAARAVALDPQWAPPWQQLAHTAQKLRLFRLGETAAVRSYQISQDQPAAARYVEALANVGRYDEALELLQSALHDDDLHDWSRCVCGYVALQLGKPDEAVRYFAAGAIDPGWHWAWHPYVVALLLEGDTASARHHSRSFLHASAGMLSPREHLMATAYDACVQGRPADAERPARLLREADLPGETEGAMALGVAWALLGNPAAWDLLATAIETDQQPTAVDTWDHCVRPLLIALADESGSVLSFSRTDAAVEHARLRGGDALSELRNAVAHRVPGEAGLAVRLTEAVLRSFGTSEERDELLDTLATEEELAAEAESLRRHRFTAEDTTDAPQPPPPTMRLRLPGSWFAAYGDPVRQHPLFARHLPALRSRTECEVPPVHVEVEEDLEPDGYQILVGDELLAEGHVDPELRYCAEEALALLPTALDAAQSVTRTAHGLAVRAEAVAAMGGLAELLTESACEVVVDRFGDVVRGDG